MPAERAWLDYDPIAAEYERIWAPRFGEVGPALVAHADVQVGDRVLDVATGTGVVAEAATAVAGEGRVVAVDASPSMLAVGAAIRPGLRARAEVINLPFADGTFDRVLCGFGLHLFAKHETALYDMIRVVRPDGVVATATWGRGGDEYQRTWKELAAFTVGNEMLKDVDAHRAPGADLFSTESGIIEVFRRAGLRKIRVEKREYRWMYPLDTYIDGLAISGSGRFIAQMLGEDGFADFMRKVRVAFRQRFPDPLQDFNEVLLSAGLRDPRK